MTKVFRYKIDHLLFWVLTVGFHAYTSADVLRESGMGTYLGEIAVRNGLLAMVIYVNLNFTIRFFEKKQLAPAFLILLVSLVGYSFLKNIYNAVVFDQPVSGTNRLFYNFSIASFYLGFAFALHFTKQWYLQRDLLRKIELEKLNTELEYLKAQINPHFLFNSINTIYFQIDKHNAEARETLSRFSELLRYQLYECNGREIPIEREVSYLTNYVELQRMRKDENYDINFNCSSTLQHFAIPPLLLIPFVENAFKHVSHFSSGKNKIQIDLNCVDNFFHLMVFNTKDTNAKSEHNGIGLKNARRRLELLYPGNHHIEIKDAENSFEVNLKFNVNTNHKEL